jgi:integrase
VGVKLTERIIDSLTCPPGRRDRLVADDVQQGLYIRVTSTGSKSYLAKYTLHGKTTKLPLGSRAALSLRAARSAAATVMGARAIGVDTAAVRKEQAALARVSAERERLTLGVLVTAWKQLHLAQRRGSYSDEAVRALRHSFAAHWGKPAESLDRRNVVAALDALQKAGHPAMASRTGAYGRALFQWALKRGALLANPFSSLPAIGPSVKRTRVLSDAELVAVWQAAVAMPPPFGRIVRLLALTGQRKSEVGEMPWSELSEDLWVWTIEPERTKNGARHVVPLSEPAAAILREMPRVEALVLPGDRRGSPFSGWSKAKARLDGLSGVTDWRLHDLRRTVATGMQRLGIRLEVTESALNHISGSRAGIVGVYQTHDYADEKREALNSWAQHIMDIVGRPQSD